MNIIFDPCPIRYFKNLKMGDIFSVENETTVYIMTGSGYHIDLNSGFTYLNSGISSEAIVHVYDASLTLKPKT